MQSDLGLAVVALDVVLVGQRAAMVLQVKLAAVHGRIGHGGVQLFHEVAHAHELRPGHAFHVGQAAGHLDLLKLRAAAAVAKAVADHLHLAQALVLDHVAPAVFRIHEVGQGLGAGEVMGLGEVGEHLRAVQARPGEGIVGEVRGVVPGHLGGDEVVHAALLHDLGDGGGVAEGIRQPEGVGGIAEVLAGEALAPEKLADHALAAGDVAVALHVHRAVGLVAALQHLGADAPEELRIMLEQHFAVEGAGLHEAVLGILLHQGELVGIGAGALLDRLAHMPEPGGIHVAVAHEARKGRGGAVFLG